MANYFVIRNVGYTRSEIRGINDHNERHKETYRNTDIDVTRSNLNCHFKSPAGSYTEMLDKTVSAGVVSLRGLKGDATLFDEFLLDVNAKYFEDHGGYDAAKNFYSIAYQFCCQEVGEANIISATMHADERNKALSDEYGHDVWHYHMHVVYLPVVRKEIRYSKRCKDPTLVGTVKETINQVSHSKRWASTPLVGADGNPVLDDRGKPVLDMSYSQLQTRFASYMQAHGYTDVERGVAGKKAQHKSIIEYKLAQDQERAAVATAKAEQLELRNQQLAEDIAVQKEALTNLQDMEAYVAEVSACRSILQEIFDAIADFFSRTTLFRDKKAESDFFDHLRGRLVSFFSRLRNLLGFELVSDMPLEHCQSPQLAEDGRKLALNLQIDLAHDKAAHQSATITKRKDYSHDSSRNF